MIQFETGTPKGSRILAGIQWGDKDDEDGVMYYDVLHYYPCQGLKYPEGYYDSTGENIPNSAIKKFAEF